MSDYYMLLVGGPITQQPTSNLAWAWRKDVQATLHILVNP
jgi:hypothetical protein